MSPYLSVIIPACNEENYIRQTLHCLKQQSCQDFEIIVVTNGCTDKTEEIIRKRVEGSEKVRYLSLPKANVCVARNAGALNAQGELLVFLDADTTLEQDSLQKIKNNFTEKYAVGTTRSKADDQKMKYRMAMAFKNFHNSTGIYKGCSGVLICRKEHFKKVEGYDPNIIVKEHHKLTSKLLEIGKYKCIDTAATTSMRRYNKWGLAKGTAFWINQWIKDKFGKLKDSDYEKIR